MMACNQGQKGQSTAKGVIPVRKRLCNQEAGQPVSPPDRYSAGALRQSQGFQLHSGR